MGIISTQAFTFRLVANGTQLDIFDDEDIIEVSTPAVLENSQEVEEYVEQKPKVELP